MIFEGCVACGRFQALLDEYEREIANQPSHFTYQKRQRRRVQRAYDEHVDIVHVRRLGLHWLGPADGWALQ